jgi:multidrug efflux pump subunit AcrA (membrane-fusion protein)
MRWLSSVSQSGPRRSVIPPLRIFLRAVERRHRRTALAITIAAISVMSPVLGTVFTFAQDRLPAGAHQKEPVPASSSPAIGKSEQFVTVVIPATIQAFFVTDLYAKDSGFVSQVNNDIGDHVKQGEVLAVIEDPELQAQHDKAQAAMQQTQADIEVAKRQLAAMQADLTLQQVTVKRQQQLRR